MVGPGREDRHLSGRVAMKTARLLMAWLLAAVFFYAAIPKIADPAGFARILHAQRLLPDVGVAPVAILLPWIEGMIALVLLGRADWRSAAATLAGGLLLIFSGVIAFNLLRGNPAACGCFSLRADAGPAGWGHVVVNLILASLAFCIVREPPPDSVP